MSLVQELKRRNVFRVAAAYIIVGWLILQVGEVLAPALHLPEWINSALAFFIILGLPLALIFAWAFEMTPEGLKKERDVDRTQSITHVTGRKLDFSIIALLALAVIYFALDKFVIQPRASGEHEAVTVQAESADAPSSIAVLPLADMSPEGDNEYFSDGLTEELLNILAKIQDLRVAGRTSSFAFKGRNEDLRDIGEKLNVDHILEGSVRKDDQRNRVRITLQLINTEDGYHLWSEIYDRDLDDIFAIQEEVAHEVAKALRVTLLGEDEARIESLASTDIDNYDLYLQARSEMTLGGFVNLDRAQELFQQVLSADPSYTPARLGLVQTWGLMANTGAMTIQEALDRGLPLLEPILAAEPDNAEAVRLMALYQNGASRVESGGSYREEADRYFQRALELDPRNTVILTEYGRFLYDNREVARGVALMDRAVLLDPYNVDVLWDSCQTSAYLGELGKALTACRRIQELEPDGVKGFYGEALAHLYKGNIARTMLGYRNAIERDPEDFEMVAAMAIFWTAVGDAEQARAWLERAEAIGAGQPVPTSARILLFEFNEQYDRAGDLARRALSRGMDDRHGTEHLFRRALAQHALRAGDPARAMETFRQAIPWAFEAELELPHGKVEWTDVILLAALFRQAEPLSSRTGELLALAEEHVDDYYPGEGEMAEPWRRAAIHALRGESELAIEELRAYKSFGILPYWRVSVPHSPAFFDLRDDPEFLAVVADLEAEAARQRAEARELLAVDS